MDFEEDFSMYSDDISIDKDEKIDAYQDDPCPRCRGSACNYCMMTE